MIGALVVVLYGIVLTFQSASLDFGRVYAAYGGAFIILSLLWGWPVDGGRPDAHTLWGAGFVMIGAGVLACWPRG